MSVKALRRKADNRAGYHRQLIAAEKSPYAALRRAVEWVVAEGKDLTRDQVPALTEQIIRVASEWNERSRP